MWIIKKIHKENSRCVQAWAELCVTCPACIWTRLTKVKSRFFQDHIIDVSWSIGHTVSLLSQANTHQIPLVGSYRSHMSLESKDLHPSLHLPPKSVPPNPYWFKLRALQEFPDWSEDSSPGFMTDPTMHNRIKLRAVYFMLRLCCLCIHDLKLLKVGHISNTCC